MEGSKGQCREHDPDVCISSNVIFDLVDHIRKHGVTWRRTGGTHSSIVSDMSGNIVTFCEDVSRASSVDKAVGGAILDGTDLSRCVLITTGRLSVTMVTKVANAGFPLVASKAAPLSGGLELAKEKDITLVAFVRRPNMYVYTGEQRIV